MNYVEQFYSTNIKLRAFEDALAETGFNTDIRHNICMQKVSSKWSKKSISNLEAQFSQKKELVFEKLMC